MAKLIEHLCQGDVLQIPARALVVLLVRHVVAPNNSQLLVHIFQSLGVQDILFASITTLWV